MATATLDKTEPKPRRKRFETTLAEDVIARLTAEAGIRGVERNDVIESIVRECLPDRRALAS